MKIAYFDCASGISGDMFLGALVDSGLPVDRLSSAIASLGVEGLALEARKVTRLGISATKVDVVSPKDDVPRRLEDIEAIIDESGLSEAAKQTAKRVFGRLVAAEAKAHGREVRKVHLHEAGALDSIADIVGAAAGLEMLGVKKCFFSPLPAGSGTVKAAHGTLPVPAPATAQLLIGVPIRESEETGELTTPTGAALARELAAGFGAVPAMTIETVGHGAGTREGKNTPNILRVFIGEPSEDRTVRKVVFIEAAVDDMSGEAVSFAMEAILASGALDAYVTPIFMKKGRPGHLITILVDEAKKDAVLETLFLQTTTLGARVGRLDREVAERRSFRIDSPFGPFRFKAGTYRAARVSVAPEYEDARRIALETKRPFKEIYARLLAEALRFIDEKDPGTERTR